MCMYVGTVYLVYRDEQHLHLRAPFDLFVQG